MACRKGTRVHDLYPAPHPDAGFERVDGRLMVASLDDMLHRFVEDDESPSYTAERIVELSDGTRTVRQIAAQIAEEFEGAAPEAIAADVRSFVSQLVEGGVLVLHNHPCPPSPAAVGSGTDPGR
jgi:Coenzyme PQQ synthesis protein D (PqqD)